MISKIKCFKKIRIRQQLLLHFQNGGGLCQVLTSLIYRCLWIRKNLDHDQVQYKSLYWDTLLSNSTLQKLGLKVLKHLMAKISCCLNVSRWLLILIRMPRFISLSWELLNLRKFQAFSTLRYLRKRSFF